MATVVTTRNRHGSVNGGPPGILPSLNTKCMRVLPTRHPCWHAVLVSATQGQVAKRFAWAAGALVAAFGALTVLVAIDPVWMTRWDTSVATSWNGAGPTGFLQVVGRAGTSAVTITALVVSVLLLWKRFPNLAVAYIAAMAGTAMTTPVLKILVDRPRPDEPIVGVNLAAYPSGHSVLVVVMATFVTATATVLAGERRWIGGLVGAFMGIVVILTCVGRIMLGAHWPSDILGGVLLGGILSTTALAGAWSPLVLKRLSPEPARSH